MKKLNLFLFIGIFSISFLVGCGKEKEEFPEVEIEEIISDIDVKVEDNKMEITHEKTESGKLFDEEIADLNDYSYFYPNLSNLTLTGTTAYTEEKVTEQFIVDTILKQFSDKKCKLESFRIDEPNEIVTYKNGLGSISYDGEFTGYLELDENFQAILEEQTTPLYEYFVIQSLVNSMCRNFYCEKIQITSGGNFLVTMYREYTEEDFVYFSTNIYNNFEIISRDDVDASRLIEQLNRAGYNFTREDYLEYKEESMREYLESLMSEDEEEILDESSIEGDEESDEELGDELEEDNENSDEDSESEDEEVESEELENDIIIIE